MSSYSGVHEELRVLYGPAKCHVCLCGNQAFDWAYQSTTAVVALVGPTGSLYSDDLRDYAPMCRPCHSRLDENHIAGGAALADKVKNDLEFAEKKRSVGRANGLSLGWSTEESEVC